MYQDSIISTSINKVKKQIPDHTLWMPWQDIDKLITVGRGQRIIDIQCLRRIHVLANCRSSGLVRQELEIYLNFRYLSEEYNRDIAFDNIQAIAKIIQEEYQSQILPMIAPQLANEVQLNQQIDYLQPKKLYEQTSIKYGQFRKDIRSLNELDVVNDEEQGFFFPDIWKYLVFRLIHKQCDRNAAFHYIVPVNNFINSLSL
jgi:hypothetical protein